MERYINYTKALNKMTLKDLIKDIKEDAKKFTPEKIDFPEF